MIEPSRQQRRQLERERLMWPCTLVQVPQEQWPQTSLPFAQQPDEAWRSRDFLVQVYSSPDGLERLSVCRTSHNGTSWQQNITWDELQRLKAECGRGEKDAVEVYPADADVVNVTNMRHLWVMPEPLSFAWRKGRGA